MTTPAVLVLEDGSQFSGFSIGASGFCVGEIVFNTSMTGYQEILTDPSYSQQLITLTYPHIGNTGVNGADNESDQIFGLGLIIRDIPIQYSNWRAQESLTDFLIRHKKPGIAGIDTRRLTKILRDKGTQIGCLVAGEEIDRVKIKVLIEQCVGLMGKDLAQDVTTSKSYGWDHSVFDFMRQGEPFRSKNSALKVVAYDFGVKKNILRLLVKYGCEVIVVPAKTSAEEALSLKPDGVFLSNGPGDPEPCSYAIEAIKVLLKQKMPLFGICLGYQLLAIASGATTKKMKFGHHGANHPVLEKSTGKVMITSQNHGFAVDESSLPDNVVATHKSLFDGSLQGIRLINHPAFGFQGHPEASPGPHDLESLFERFIDLMRDNQERSLSELASLKQA